MSFFNKIKKAIGKKEEGPVASPGGGPKIWPMAPELQERLRAGVRCSIKVVIRGMRRTGKSALLSALHGHPFPGKYTPSEGIAAATIHWQKNKDDLRGVKVEVWDVVDQGAESRPNSPMHKGGNDDSARKGSQLSQLVSVDASTIDIYPGTHCVIFMVDVTRRETFEYVKQEAPKVPQTIAVLICLNFSDARPDQREVTDLECDTLCNSLPRATTKLVLTCNTGERAEGVKVPKSVSAAASWINTSIPQRTGFDLLWSFLEIPTNFVTLETLETQMKMLFTEVELVQGNLLRMRAEQRFLEKERQMSMQMCEPDTVRRMVESPEANDRKVKSASQQQQQHSSSSPSDKVVTTKPPVNGGIQKTSVAATAHKAPAAPVVAKKKQDPEEEEEEEPGKVGGGFFDDVSDDEDEDELAMRKAEEARKFRAMESDEEAEEADELPSRLASMRKASSSLLSNSGTLASSKKRSASPEGDSDDEPQQQVEQRKASGKKKEKKKKEKKPPTPEPSPSPLPTPPVKEEAALPSLGEEGANVDMGFFDDDEDDEVPAPAPVAKKETPPQAMPVVKVAPKKSAPVPVLEQSPEEKEEEVAPETNAPVVFDLGEEAGGAADTGFFGGDEDAGDEEEAEKDEGDGPEAPPSSSPPRTPSSPMQEEKAASGEEDEESVAKEAPRVRSAKLGTARVAGENVSRTKREPMGVSAPPPPPVSLAVVDEVPAGFDMSALLAQMQSATVVGEEEEEEEKKEKKEKKSKKNKEEKEKSKKEKKSKKPKKEEEETFAEPEDDDDGGFEVTQ